MGNATMLILAIVVLVLVSKLVLKHQMLTVA